MSRGNPSPDFMQHPLSRIGTQQKAPCVQGTDADVTDKKRA
ncbi:hypothetical protein B14911_20413 [Bacillus sp. NRRL B-14911]|uniref:Uncharacterized protein n=1 Tax=Bacillus infantis NRRL B-14911 TaxID=1367477 RepID=U5L981_9BACI|nr:hypothetical protein N288_06775 [Bacillus infantis NRRL B-14911]EAR63589.1 hypothetical protein B14911_20413 [Bacillus sp. NRRL B-14911]